MYDHRCAGLLLTLYALRLLRTHPADTPSAAGTPAAAAAAAAAAAGPRREGWRHLVGLFAYRLLTPLALVPACFAVWVGASRVHDNWHHPSDVATGLLLGGSCAAIAFGCYFGAPFRNRSPKRNPKPKPNPNPSPNPGPNPNQERPLARPMAMARVLATTRCPHCLRRRVRLRRPTAIVRCRESLLIQRPTLGSGFPFSKVASCPVIPPGISSEVSQIAIERALRAEPPTCCSCSASARCSSCQARSTALRCGTAAARASSPRSCRCPRARKTSRHR